MNRKTTGRIGEKRMKEEPQISLHPMQSWALQNLFGREELSVFRYLLTEFSLFGGNRLNPHDLMEIAKADCATGFEGEPFMGKMKYADN